MLTKAESAELLMRINAYASAVLVLVAYAADIDRRRDLVENTAAALDRLLEYVEEIS